MRDILSQGDEERRPGSGPRRLAAAAALAVLAAVAIAANLPHHQPARARPARTASQAGRAPQPPAGPDIAVAGLPRQPSGIIGPALPWDSSLRLPVTGQQPSWYYPASGRRVPIGGLLRDRSGYQFTRVGGGWAIQPGTTSLAGCDRCAGPPQPVYFLADQGRPAARIGVADQVAPAAASGPIWLTSYRPGAGLSTALGTAREVSVARPPRTLDQVQLPAGYMIARQTDRGLLLAPMIPRPGMTAYRLWDPAARRFGRAFAGVIAASPTEVAWTPPCSGLCRTRVLDLATGRQTTVRLPRGSSAANAAFSPDGEFLALQVSVGSGGNGGALAMQLEVASVASGRLAVVPGTWASSDALVGFGWPDGPRDRLVAELSFTSQVQVTSWQPGAALLAVAAVRPGLGSATLIVG